MANHNIRKAVICADAPTGNYETIEALLRTFDIGTTCIRASLGEYDKLRYSTPLKEADLFVMDCQLSTDACEKETLVLQKPFLAIDRSHARRHAATHIINTNPQISAKHYKGLVDVGCRIYAMTDFLEDCIEFSETNLFAFAFRDLVVTNLQPASARDNRRVTLRLANQSDVHRLFAWQLDDRTRRYARNTGKPTWEEHAAWFKRHLLKIDSFMCIILYQGEPAGSIRLDLISSNTFEISLVTDPKFYRQGVGLPAISLVRELMPSANLRAIVLEGNTASRMMVEEAGFYEVEAGYFVNPPKAKSNRPADEKGLNYD